MEERVASARERLRGARVSELTTAATTPSHRSADDVTGRLNRLERRFEADGSLPRSTPSKAEGSVPPSGEEENKPPEAVGSASIPLPPKGVTPPPASATHLPPPRAPSPVPPLRAASPLADKLAFVNFTGPQVPLPRAPSPGPAPRINLHDTPFNREEFIRTQCDLDKAPPSHLSHHCASMIPLVLVVFSLCGLVVPRRTASWLT